MTTDHTTITLGRRELIAKLAAIVNRMTHNSKEDEAVQPTVHRISAFITECGKEFDLSNEEQLLFLKFVVLENQSAEELLATRA